MRRTTALAQILGSGHGIDPFATTGRWPSRQHPRRDGEGHDSGEGGNTDQGTDGGGAGDEGDGKPDDGGKKSGDDEKLGEGGKKALEAERARAKAAEQEVAKYKAAAEKDRLAKLDDQQRAEAERDKAAEEAEQARKELAVERAARKHGITDDKDIELLAGVPAEQVDALAKRLAPKKDTGKDFGNEVGGGKQRSSTELPDGFLDKIGKSRSGITLY
ncbi:hypothetical protein [Rhodococcus sp. Chr-9]|uniref:hypothetical protein n=1 Tax=Rhodococcus sp. Chr-9 TaxID=713612 RepID=UPI00068FEF86|nr:hypothetical protein [Rhodococcus sp. Chr-9]